MEIFGYNLFIIIIIHVHLYSTLSTLVLSYWYVVVTIQFFSLKAYLYLVNEWNSLLKTLIFFILSYLFIF